MRFLIAVAIAMAVSFLPLQKAKKLTQSKIAVEKIIKFLMECRSRITYSEDAISRIIENYIETNTEYVPLFILRCCDYLEFYDLPFAWKKAINENTREISDKDRDLLLSLGNSLGVSDKNSQIKLLDYMIHEFEISHSEKKQKEFKEKKLYCAVGIFSAFMIFILII